MYAKTVKTRTLSTSFEYRFSTITITRDDSVSHVKAFVTDFTDAMGYCEFKIPFLVEGVKVKTAEMVIGSVHHEELERIERETVTPIPLTREKLQDKKADLSFMREDVTTVFAHEFDLSSGVSRVTLFGRADKVYREDEVLVVSDDKHTANPGRHDGLKNPYTDQLLQVLAYLHSRYDLG